MKLSEKTGKIVTADEQRGTFEVLTPRRGNVASVRLTFEKGPSLVVPANLLVPQRGKTYRIPLRRDELAEAKNVEAVIPLIAERLRVRKKEVVTGGVRIKKQVKHEAQVIDEPLWRENIEIKRVPVNRYVENAVPIRQDGDTTIIPVYEEAIVVEKRLLLREEVVIRKQRVETHSPQKVTRRYEDIVVEDVKRPGTAKPRRTNGKA